MAAIAQPFRKPPALIPVELRRCCFAKLPGLPSAFIVTFVFVVISVLHRAAAYSRPAFDPGRAGKMFIEAAALRSGRATVMPDESAALHVGVRGHLSSLLRPSKAAGFHAC